MLTGRYQETTDNQPDIILTLVADGTDASEAWGHSFNESRYLPYAPQASNGDICELEPSPNDPFREKTPPAERAAPRKEPTLQLTFSNPPKNRELGYLLGSDEEVCDVYLGPTDQAISACMLCIYFNECNELTLRSSNSTINSTRVTYSINKTQEVERKHFSWVLPPEADSIHVNVADHIGFWVVIPKHVTDEAAYQANCLNFKRLADSATHTHDLPYGWSLPSVTLASGVATPQGNAEPPFYLRTAKLGSGGFGKVYKGIRMPDGRAVAIKTFKGKNAWTLEKNILENISKTPHDNIVQFIDLGLEKRPYLVMGLAPGGNLAEQQRSLRFKNSEIVLIARQMLDALVFLHVEHNIIHRDIKMENILCDSREHFRLADFGIAKKGSYLGSMKGTKPWMAPEMVLGKFYTSKVDVYGLGLVIALLLTGNLPRQYINDEGLRWCEDLISHFNRYEERIKAEAVGDQEQVSLTALVNTYMLRMEPDDRDSAPDCLERVKLLWQISETSKWIKKNSNDNSNSILEGNQDESLSSRLTLDKTKERSKDIGLTEKHESLEEEELGSEEEEELGSKEEEELGSEEEGVLEGEDMGDQDPAEDVDMEATTEARTLNTAEWSSLDREHPLNEGEQRSVSQEFKDGNFADNHENPSEASPPAAPLKKRKWSS